MLDHPEVKRFARVAELLAKKGWAEANAGNLSTCIDPTSLLVDLTGAKTVSELKHPFPSLEGAFFLVTATKSRARDIPLFPEKNIGLLEIGAKGTKVICHWGAQPPTSEFPAHLSIYSALINKRPDIRSVLHTHPPNLIALSHIPEMRETRKLNHVLRMMHPEVGILVPDGVAFIDYRIPGSIDLGQATCDALLERNLVIWPMHGVVSVATDLDRALDQIEIIEKAAQIYMLVRSIGLEPLGLTPKQIEDSRKFWGIDHGTE